MTEREWLINNLFGKISKYKNDIKNTLLNLNEIVLVSHRENKKITMIIKIEDEK